MSEQEWMTSSQAKEKFGLTFKVLMALAKREVIKCKHIYSDVAGEDVFIFNVKDVRNYIESL